MQKTIRDVLSKETRVALKKIGYRAKVDKLTKERYSKELHLTVFRGYDLLENFLLARQYIQKKYGINFKLLEILLYLTPKHYWTQADFAKMPKNFSYCSVKNLINTGYVGTVQEGKTINKNIYKINTKGRNLVHEMYEILSGEKKVSLNPGLNPLMKKNTTTAFQKKAMGLIKEINLLPAPESKKGFYQ